MTTLHFCRCEICGVEFRLARHATICADCEEKGLTANDFYDPQTIGSGFNPSVYCSRCHRPFGTAVERCPKCHQPQWMTQITRMVRRWSAQQREAMSREIGERR